MNNEWRNLYRGMDYVKYTNPLRNREGLEKCVRSERFPFGLETNNFDNNRIYFHHFNRTASDHPEREFEHAIDIYTRFDAGWLRFVSYCLVNQTNNPNEAIWGRKLFYYHKGSNCYQWQNPKLLRNLLINFSIRSIRRQNNLPPNWQCKIKPYPDPAQPNRHVLVPIFINTETKKVQWEDPRVTEAKIEMLEFFRKLNKQKQCSRLALRRQSLLLDLEAQLAWWEVRQLHPHKIQVSFNEGDAYDAGGLLREAVTLITETYFDESLCLFMEEEVIMDNIDDIHYGIHPLSSSNVYNLRHYYLFGRFLGLIFFMSQNENLFLPVMLSDQILSSLSGKNVIPLNACLKLKSLSYCKYFYNAIKPIYDQYVKCKKEEIIRQLVEGCFSYDEPLFDESFIFLIKPGSYPLKKLNDASFELIANEKMTEVVKQQEQTIKYTVDMEKIGDLYELRSEDTSNRAKVRRIKNLLKTIERLLTREFCLPQLQAIKNGIKDVVPLVWFQIFTANELKSQLCAELAFDYVQFLQNINWRWHCDMEEENERLRLRLMQLTDEMKQQLREQFLRIIEQNNFGKQLLRAATGYSKPPLQGGFRSIPITIIVMWKKEYNRQTQQYEPNRHLPLRFGTCSRVVEVNLFVVLQENGQFISEEQFTECIRQSLFHATDFSDI